MSALEVPVVEPKILFTSEPSDQNKSCSECQQDVRNIFFRYVNMSVCQYVSMSVCQKRAPSLLLGKVGHTTVSQPENILTFMITKIKTKKKLYCLLSIFYCCLLFAVYCLLSLCLLYTSDAADEGLRCRSRWSPYH